MKLLPFLIVGVVANIKVTVPYVEVLSILVHNTVFETLKDVSSCVIRNYKSYSEIGSLGRVVDGDIEVFDLSTATGQSLVLVDYSSGHIMCEHYTYDDKKYQLVNVNAPISKLSAPHNFCKTYKMALITFNKLNNILLESVLNSMNKSLKAASSDVTIVQCTSQIYREFDAMILFNSLLDSTKQQPLMGRLLFKDSAKPTENSVALEIYTNGIQSDKFISLPVYSPVVLTAAFFQEATVEDENALGLHLIDALNNECIPGAADFSLFTSKVAFVPAVSSITRRLNDDFQPISSNVDTTVNVLSLPGWHVIFGVREGDYAALFLQTALTKFVPMTISQRSNYDKRLFSVINTKVTPMKTSTYSAPNPDGTPSSSSNTRIKIDTYPSISRTISIDDTLNLMITIFETESTGCQISVSEGSDSAGWNLKTTSSIADGTSSANQPTVRCNFLDSEFLMFPSAAIAPTSQSFSPIVASSRALTGTQLDSAQQHLQSTLGNAAFNEIHAFHCLKELESLSRQALIFKNSANKSVKNVFLRPKLLQSYIIKFDGEFRSRLVTKLLDQMTLGVSPTVAPTVPVILQNRFDRFKLSMCKDAMTQVYNTQNGAQIYDDKVDEIQNDLDSPKKQFDDLFKELTDQITNYLKDLSQSVDDIKTQYKPLAESIYLSNCLDNPMTAPAPFDKGLLKTTLQAIKSIKNTKMVDVGQLNAEISSWNKFQIALNDQYAKIELDNINKAAEYDASHLNIFDDVSLVSIKNCLLNMKNLLSNPALDSATMQPNVDVDFNTFMAAAQIDDKLLTVTHGLQYLGDFFSQLVDPSIDPKKITFQSEMKVFNLMSTNQDIPTSLNFKKWDDNTWLSGVNAFESVNSMKISETLAIISNFLKSSLFASPKNAANVVAYSKVTADKLKTVSSKISNLNTVTTTFSQLDSICTSVFSQMIVELSSIDMNLIRGVSFPIVAQKIFTVTDLASLTVANLNQQLPISSTNSFYNTISLNSHYANVYSLLFKEDELKTFTGDSFAEYKDAASSVQQLAFLEKTLVDSIGKHENSIWSPNKNKYMKYRQAVQKVNSGLKKILENEYISNNLINNNVQSNTAPNRHSWVRMVLDNLNMYKTSFQNYLKTSAFKPPVNVPPSAVLYNSLLGAAQQNCQGIVDAVANLPTSSPDTSQNSAIMTGCETVVQFINGKDSSTPGLIQNSENAITTFQSIEAASADFSADSSVWKPNPSASASLSEDINLSIKGGAPIPQNVDPSNTQTNNNASSSANTSAKDDGLGVGAILGIVGGVIFLILIALLIYFKFFKSNGDEETLISMPHGGSGRMSTVLLKRKSESPNINSIRSELLIAQKNAAIVASAPPPPPPPRVFPPPIFNEPAPVSVYPPPVDQSNAPLEVYPPPSPISTSNADLLEVYPTTSIESGIGSHSHFDASSKTGNKKRRHSVRFNKQ